MTTIPSRLARTVRLSSGIEDARAKARSLYRDWYRCAPEMVTIHSLTIPPSLIRSRIRAEYERHRFVEDPKVLDILVQKSRQDFQEVMNAWGQESHILGLILKDKTKESKTFLQKFYEGRDEEAVSIASPPTSYP
ncbi:hypothetical protein FRB95_010549 [Tulasnella sp. JGI-2019a]|nr:hypothetical protein FRB93_012773 [Tulasnella sp. JGI-2019a]KAG9035781.1 hypothetical protein FRB95_010549 [Tulasnella sp. JGI-2019a]